MGWSSETQEQRQRNRGAGGIEDARLPKERQGDGLLGLRTGKSTEKVLWGRPHETNSVALKGQPKQRQENRASRRAVPAVSRAPHRPSRPWPRRAETGTQSVCQAP